MTRQGIPWGAAVLLALVGASRAQAAGETERAVVRSVLPTLGAQDLAQSAHDGVFYTQAANYGGGVTLGGWGSGRLAADVSLRGPLASPESACRPQEGETPVDALPGARVLQVFEPARPPSSPGGQKTGPFADRDWAGASARWRVVYPAHCLVVSALFDGDDPGGRRVIGRVRELAESLHRQMLSSGLARGPAERGKPLCDEALRFFGLVTRPSSTHIRRDRAELEAGFRASFERYQQEHPEAPAFVSVPRGGGSDVALNWLFAEGGALANLTHAGDMASEDFVFTDRAEARRLVARQSRLVDGRLPARHGTEGALLRAIVKTSGDEQRRLEPGDVFYLALEQVGGDARLATLLAHNTLRSLARGADADYTGVAQDLSAFQKYLAPLRGGTEELPDFQAVEGTPEPGNAGDSRPLERPEVKLKPDPFAGDNAGPWYHLFGTAYFELQVEGEFQTSVLRDLLAAERPAAPDRLPAGKIESSRASQLANTLEQYYREKLGGAQPDPEKYCFNVWGAEIGALLGKGLLDSGRRRVGPTGARDRPERRTPVDPLDPGLSDGTPSISTPTLAQQIERARTERDRTFEKYTKLVTEGGEGDVQAALAEYRRAQQRLVALEEQARQP